MVESKRNDPRGALLTPKELPHVQSEGLIAQSLKGRTLNDRDPCKEQDHLSNDRSIYNANQISRSLSQGHECVLSQFVQLP